MAQLLPECTASRRNVGNYQDTLFYLSLPHSKLCLYLSLNLQWYEKFPSRTSLNRQSLQLLLSLSSLNKAGKEDAVNLAVIVLYVKG